MKKLNEYIYLGFEIAIRFLVAIGAAGSIMLFANLYSHYFLEITFSSLSFCGFTAAIAILLFLYTSEIKNKYVYLDYASRTLLYVLVAWLIMLAAGTVVYIFTEKTLPKFIFFLLIIAVATSLLLSKNKRLQKIYIWFDLAYQLFLQFCVAWCTTLIASSYIHRTTGAIIKASSFYSIVIVIMMMLFLLVWRNYPRLIHNLLLTFVILFEFVNIFYSNVTFLRTLENFNYPITNTTKLIINIITCPLPLLSYIAAFTNKKLFWGLLMYSVTIFIAFFF